MRVVDISESNAWAEFAGLFCATHSAFADHERAKSRLKSLMPERSNRSRRSRQTLEVGRGQLRSSRPGGQHAAV